MKSMWWFESSSFSKSTGANRKPAKDDGGGSEATIASTSSSVVSDSHGSMLTSFVLWDWLVLVDLDLDAALWGELGDFLSLDNLSKDGRISFPFEAIVEGM